MSPLKFGLSELRLYGGQLSLQDRDKEVPASARRLQETRVDALALTLHQIKHVFDQPPRREHLSVVCNAPLGLDQIHSDGLLSRPAALCGGDDLLVHRIGHTAHRITYCVCESKMPRPSRRAIRC